MRKTGWRELRKRLLALGIAAVMVGNTVDLSALQVLAQEQSADVEHEEEDKVAVLAEDSQSEKESAALEGDLESAGDSDDLTKDPESVEESTDPVKDSGNLEETISESEGVSEDESESEKSDDVEVQEQSSEDDIALMADSAVAEADDRTFNTLQDAFDYVSNEAPGFPTVKLLHNVTLDNYVYPDGRITLDLNGKTVSRELKEDMVGKTDSVFLVESGAILTIKDTSEDDRGQIVQPNICPAVTVNGGNVIIESGTIKATSTDADNNRAIEISRGSVTINDGVIEGAQIGVCTWGGSNLTVKGGSINGGTSYALLVKGGDVKLSGGTYSTDATDGYSIWNENGTAASLLASSTLTYMTDDGEESEISTDEKGVKGKTTVETAPERVAYIEQGGVEKSRTDCKEITSGDTVSLSDGWYVVKADAEVGTLDITGTDANLILGDGATLRVKEQIKSSTGGNPDQNLLKIYLQGDGTGVLVAEKGHDAKTLNIGKKGTPMKMANSEGELADARYYYTISKCDHSKVDYKSNETYHGGACVYCGTYVQGRHNFDNWNCNDEKTHTGICTVCGYESTVEHEIRYIENPDGLTHKSFCKDCNLAAVDLPHVFYNGKCVDCYTKAAAEVSDKTYTSLPAALNAAQNGDTIKLLANYMTDWEAVKNGDFSSKIIVGKKLTLDLNGFEIDDLSVGQTVNLSTGEELETPISGDLTIRDSGLGSVGRAPCLELAKGKLTIESGEIGRTGYTDSFVCSDKNGEVNITGGVVRFFDCEGGIANITGGKVYQLFVSSIEGSEPVVNISGGTNHGGQNDGSNYDIAAWSVNHGSTLNITGGTFGKIHFSYTGGTVDISGGTFQYLENYDDNSRTPVMSLLAKGYAFYSKDASGEYTVLQKSTETKLEDVKVLTHTHTSGTCACGFTTAAKDNNDDVYSSLQQALNAATADSNIKWVQLESDVSEAIVFDVAGKSVTLKMNGKKLECANGIPLTVKNGTLTIADAANIVQTGDSRNTLDCAISITGGKLIFEGNLTAKGGSFNGDGNLPAQKPAVYAEGGELDFQGDLDLKGSLTVTGSAMLTNGLTQGTFSAENGIDAKRISVEDSSNYKHVEELLAFGYTFVDKNDTSKFPCANASYKYWTGDVTIVPHTHTWGPEPGELYACTVCGKTCAHLDGYKTGKCEVCGKPCPHAIADQSPVDHNYYCNDCGEQMFARIQTDTYEWLHFTNLVDAMNAAGDGQTIVLLSDINQGEQRAAVVGNGKTVTLDLRNHTITNGYISVGKSSQYTSSTLKIIGTGSFVRTGRLGNLTVYPGGTLDLSEWTGGTISELDILDDSNAGDTLRKQTSLMVGQNAGTIGLLWITNWQFDADNTAKAINLRGGSYETVRIGGWTADQISLGDLLKSGYAFKYTIGDEYVSYDRKLTERQDGIGDINYVSVVSCAHGGTKGFEINADICSYCKIASAVAKATLTNVGSNPWRNFASLQSAIDAKRKDGSAITLLTDVDGDYTVNTEATFDLSGHTINGKVTVNNAKVTFSNSGSNGTIENVVMSGSNAKFGTSSAPAIINILTVKNGATLKSILPSRYGYKVFDGDHYSWYDENVTGTYLTKVSVTELPFSARNLFLKVKGEEVTEVERGMTVQLCAQVDTADVDQMIFYIKKAEDGTTLVELRDDKVMYEEDGTNCYYVAEYTFDEMGDYLISFIAEKDRYQGQSSEQSLTVTRVSVPVNEITAPTGVDNLIYNGLEQPLIKEGNVDSQYGTMQYSLNGQTWSTSIPCGLDAGTYTVYYKVEGNTDYKDSEVMNLTVTIAPKTVTDPAIELNGDMIYTGSEIRPTVTVKDGKTVIPADEYTISYSSNINAGTANVTIEDKAGGNYTVSGSTTFTIGKADSKITTAPTANTLTYNGEEQALIIAGIADGGTMQYRLGDSGDFGIDIPKAVNAGTYTIYYKVAGDSNHNDVTDTASVDVTIAKANQQALCITSDTTVIYGQTLQMTTIGGTGTGAVTYSIDQNNSTGEAKIDGSTGILTPVKVGTVKVTAAKAEDSNHNAITSEEVDITIAKATPTGEPKYTRITARGKTLADAGLTLTGSSLKLDAGTLEWVDADGNVLPDNTRVEANKTYKWRFTPADNNYDILTGEVELYHVTSGSGGSRHHHSSSDDSGSSAGTTAPTSPAVSAETTKISLPKVKLPGTKTDAQTPADETNTKESYVEGDTDKTDVTNADDTNVDVADIPEDLQQADAENIVSEQTSGNIIWIILLLIAVILTGAGIVLVQKRKKKEE